MEGTGGGNRDREREIFLYISTLPVPLADTLPLYLCVSVCLCVPCVTVVAGADRETGFGLCWSVSVKSACQSLWLSNSCGTSLICRFKQCRCRMFVSLCNTVTSQVCCKNALTFVDMKQKGFFFFLFQRGSNNFSGITFPAASPLHKNCQLRVIPSKQLPVKAL